MNFEKDFQCFKEKFICDFCLKSETFESIRVLHYHNNINVSWEQMRTERFYMDSDLSVCQVGKESIMLDGFIFIVFYQNNRISHILLLLTCQRF